MKWFVLVLFLLLPEAVDAKTVVYDLGGSIADRLNEMQHLDKVEILGICASACTLYLGLPKTCVSEDAQLGFHSPSTKLKTPLLRPDWENATQLMAKHYPKALAKWFLETARFSTDVIYLSGKDVIELGVKPCEQEKLNG